MLFLIVSFLMVCNEPSEIMGGFAQCKSAIDKFVNASEVRYMNPYAFVYCNTSPRAFTTEFDNCNKKPTLGCELVLKDGTTIKTQEYCGEYRKKVL